MFETISKAGKGKRGPWQHQSDALNFAIDHLNNIDSPCLIRMPTGAGKTGVIACLTRISNQGSSLVLTPWANLRRQMVDDLETNFWGKVDLTPKNLRIVPMLPSTADEILKWREPQVIVATFTTLNDLRREYPDKYTELAKTVSLVIVDEGHYEPAVEWGKSVKGLNIKTLLLTATPYRNDLKLFRITNPGQSTYHFTHKDAVEKKIIREIRLEELISSTDVRSLSDAFARKWKAAKRAKTLPSGNPRAIICCTSANDIKVVVTRLKAAGLNAIGIHERFEDSASKSLFKDVPKDPRSTDAEVWVHQNKLTEGLDDHRFCCIALFTRIRNDRKMIQQIGRVLRRDKDDRNAPAVLLAPAKFSVEAAWLAYREFETDLKLLEPQHFREVVEKVLDLQPNVEYFEGRFRKRFNPADLSRSPQVIIPPSVLVRTVDKDFSLNEYIEDCTDTLNTNDAVILGTDINGPCQKSATYALWVYASIQNSRFLQNTSLYEIKLETHCVVFADDIVLITDSTGNFPEEYLEERTMGIPHEKLIRYLDKRFRPTHVSLNSSIPYDTVLRGASLHGHNILSVPASLTDRVQICRSARGSSKDSGRRYVGMSNGRVRKEVTEEDRRSFELNTFVSWAESVAKILNSKIDGNVLFHRYLQTCAPPANPIPKTISIDLLSHDLNLTMADGRECRLKNSSSDFKESQRINQTTYTCSFDLEGVGIHKKSISLQIEYQSVKQRFWFTKEKGEAIQMSIEGNEASSKGLAEFLNQKQDIILIGLDGGDIVYQGRNFYKIDYTFAEQVLLDLIKRPQNVSRYRTEKGSKDQIAKLRNSKATIFPKGSLFRSVADRSIDLPFVDDLLICDDLGTECADFVAANLEKHQLALIHAKAGDGKKISASAFHDVVAQAMKNLVYLTRNGEVPPGVGSWTQDAKWNRTHISRLYRSPAGLPSRRPLWSKLKSDILDSSNPELYVVLVTTGCCDVDELKKAATDPNRRTPEIAQLLHLLDGVNGYARQLGVRLVVYDLPYQSN